MSTSAVVFGKWNHSFTWKFPSVCLTFSLASAQIAKDKARTHWWSSAVCIHRKQPWYHWRVFQISDKNLRVTDISSSWLSDFLAWDFVIYRVSRCLWWFTKIVANRREKRERREWTYHMCADFFLLLILGLPHMCCFSSGDVEWLIGYLDSHTLRRLADIWRQTRVKWLGALHVNLFEL